MPRLLCLLPLLLLQGAAAPNEIARIEAAVAEIRGLPFKRPVAVKVVTSAAARSHFAERAEKLWPKERVALDQAVYANLGLLPAGFDLLSSFLDLLEEQALGYYDPGSDTLYLVDSAAGAETASMLIAHELTHALDDQHFDLEALLASRMADDDKTAAMSAVMEGSGTAVMTVFLAREIGAGRITISALQAVQKTEAARAQRLKATPSVIQRSLLASYILGLSFLTRGNPARLVAGLDAADLSRAFTDPPQSSEQILHPEKYWDEAARDLPRRVTLPDLSKRLGTGWSLASRGTLGELGLASLTGAPPLELASPEALQPARWTSGAAAGLGGDLYHHYVHGARSVTVLATVWDTERDAVEFQDGIVTLPRKRSFRFGDAVVVLGGVDLGPEGEVLAGEVLSTLSATATAPRP